MRILILVYSLFAFSLTPTCFTQWLQQPSGVTTPLYNVEFVNPNTGWATGNGSKILKTTNGGVNWFQQTINLGYPKNLYGLDMLDANTGYIAGWFETILKTTNGGNNWIIISNIPSNDGNSNHGISFINSFSGWVCSSLGRVLRTTNGGISWDTAFVSSGGPLRDVQFVSSQIGWVCGEGGYLHRSTNGGVNWVEMPFMTSSNFPSLNFINVNTGWVVSEQQNQVYKTTNGGLNWNNVAVLTGGSLQYSYSIYFYSSMIGYIGGTSSRLFKTSNGGFNWIQQNVPIAMYIGNFSFVNDSTGWGVGGGGGIIRTTNGGTYVVIENITNGLPNNFYLRQNYPNPFNSSSIIEFEISKSSNVSIIIFDILGREIGQLFNQKINPGVYKVQLDANDIASGTYFYSLIADGNLINTKKFILIK
ncbi:MAG: T9SS C-terminal target domain-containing protein [Ignavibacteriae bacterium]|nr:MAG: T9SS C-terminal target domain-containing protein [Ignavibacteriota bacterium]